MLYWLVYGPAVVHHVLFEDVVVEPAGLAEHIHLDALHLADVHFLRRLRPRPVPWLGLRSIEAAAPVAAMPLRKVPSFHLSSSMICGFQNRYERYGEKPALCRPRFPCRGAVQTEDPRSARPSAPVGFTKVLVQAAHRHHPFIPGLALSLGAGHRHMAGKAFLPEQGMGRHFEGRRT